MFKVDEDTYALQDSVNKFIGEYQIRVGDQVELKVFANNGEIIIDPGTGVTVNTTSNQQGNGSFFVVYPDSVMRLPMIGEVAVVGFTGRQLDSALSSMYSKYYEGAYAITKVKNKRVIVIGPQGGKIIPFETQSMHLIELIALYGGMENDAKAYNIRLIRGDLKNPQVTVVDLSTIKAMTQNNLQILPDDIVYIEPVRRPFQESLQDNFRWFTVINSLLTLVLFFRAI